MPSSKPKVTFRADSEEQIARWRAAAEDAGVSLNDWIRARLDAMEVLAPSVPEPEKVPAPEVEVPAPKMKRARASSARRQPDSVKEGECFAFASVGTRCRFCGKVHKLF